MPCHLKEDEGKTHATKTTSPQQETKEEEKKGLAFFIMNMILESDDKRMTPI
jgi:hypothetical protein